MRVFDVARAFHCALPSKTPELRFSPSVSKVDGGKVDRPLHFHDVK